MSSLKGKKPHTNGWYLCKETGKMVKILRSSYERVQLQEELTRETHLVDTETFYEFFRRVRDYTPQWRHPWENK